MSRPQSDFDALREDLRKVIFFTMGGHADYHQVTDEPQYIDYDRMARVSQYVADLATKVANLDHRPNVDKPKPDPHGQCVQ